MRKEFLILAILGTLASGLSAQGIGPGAAVPAVANIPGAAGTFWQSDVIIQNPGETSTNVRLLLFPEIQSGEPAFDPMTSDSISVPAHGQVIKSNVVQSVFGLVNVKGALSVISEDGSPVVIGSRTYTFNEDGGSYGQEVFGVLVKDRAWAGGLTNDSLYRTNIGVYLPMSPAEGSSLYFELIFRDGEGEEIGRGGINFPAAGLVQRPVGSIIGDPIPAASVEVVCSDPDAVWYGYVSRVDQLSGDAVYRPLRGMAP